MKLSTAKKHLLVGLSLATLATAGASPVFATSHHQASQSLRQLYMYAPGGADADRDAALRDCDAAVAKYSNKDWQTTQAAVYGNCMAKYHQVPSAKRSSGPSSRSAS